MHYALGNIQNPVYYSFQSEDRKFIDNKQLAEKMSQRLAKLHQGRFFKVEVYDNQESGKPRLFEFRQNDLL